MKNLRTLQIIDFLKDRKYCSIRELQTKFGVSCATIHRDVTALVSRGVLQRVHGGVAFSENPADQQRKTLSPFLERIEWNKTAKQEIAMRAIREIQEGDILFLDSSTTVYSLSRLLLTSSFSNLTIITNSVMIIQDFCKMPSHYVLIGLGGGYDLQLNAFLGQATLRELEFLNITKAFLSAFGWTDESVTTNHERHASLLMKVMQRAQQKILLADHSKFNREGLFRFASKKAFDQIITDRE